MKAIVKHLALLTSLVVAMSVTSCVSDGLTEPGNDVVGKEIATLEEQASLVMTTISDVEALKETADGHEVELNGVIRSLESHVSYLSSGSSWEDATLATLAEQKKLAAVVGPILAQTEAASATKTTLNSLDANAKSWLGKNLGSYWSAALAEARTNAVLTVLGSRMNTQKIHVEGLASDVEAGLKKDDKPEELESLTKSVTDNIKDAEELEAIVSDLVADLEETYRAAVQTAAQDPESYDTKSVNVMNKAAAVALAANEVTLQSLEARVAACEEQLEDIRKRLGELENKIDKVEGLLDLIQSVTLMQDNSSDYAVAYYNLDPDNITDEGYMDRIPQESIDLRYLVRPASAAAALAETDLRNNGLIKVIGYYAKAITKADVEIFDLNILDVKVDDESMGLVTVTVDNAFDSKDFYFKKTGAKVALSITTGQTDITSKFVEVVPQDASGTVYAESLTITDRIEMDFNESAAIKAVLNPTGADQTLIWESDDNSIVTVSQEGVLTTKGIGTATVTATTNTTDEWGRKLSATCNVTVNPDIKIVGYKYVEKGSTLNLKLDSPRSIHPDLITWTSSNNDAVSIEKAEVDGLNCAVVTGNKVAYSDGKYEDITVTCKIQGEFDLTYTIQCVEVQPSLVSVDDLENNVNEITLKFGESKIFNASILPNSVDAEKFTMAYDIEGALSLSGTTVTAHDETKLKDGKTTGTFTISVDSDYYWYDNTIQQSADKLTREITVNVEPYYVTALKLPDFQNMTTGQVLNTLPDIVFTSDVSGHAPSYTDLVWSSSAPEYVSVDPNTGQLTARQLTTSPVTITANMKDPEKSVKPGCTVSATCMVTVTEVAAGAPKVGDYYYTDGSWSTDLDNKKTVVGIIFSLANAADDTNGDPNLDDKYSHGLVVSVSEYNAKYSNDNYYNNPLADPAQLVSGDTLYEFVKDNYDNVNYNYNLDRLNGYSSTLVLKDWRKEKGDKWDTLVTVLDEDLPIAPSESSGWYIPSFKELLLLYDEKSSVNNSLSEINETQIEQSNYWSSSLYYNGRKQGVSGWYDDSMAQPFDMTNGTMSKPESGFGPYSTEYPVRVILAF